MIQTRGGVEGQESVTDLRHFANGSCPESNYSIETSVPLYNCSDASDAGRHLPFATPLQPIYRYVGQVPPHPDVITQNYSVDIQKNPWKVEESIRILQSSKSKSFNV